MRIGILGILSILTIVSGAHAQSHGSLVNDVDLERVGFRRYWDAHLPVAPRESIKHAYLVDKALYVTTNSGVFFSLEADTGLIRWVDHLTEANFTIYRPTHARTSDGKGPVVVLTTNDVFVLDRYNGARLTRFDPGFAPGSAPLAIGPNYFAGSNNGRFYALAVRGKPVARAFKKWEVAVGTAVTATPFVYEGDKLLFAAEDGGVYSCFASDKTLLWSYRLGGGIAADPAIDSGAVYVAGLDRALYKLSLGGGHLMWRVRFDDPLRDGPAVAAHTVFQYSPSSGLVALDADTGKKKWTNKQARRFAAHGPARNVLYTDDQRLLIVDHETGAQVGVIDIPDATGVITNSESDAVFVLGTLGRITCLRLDDVPYLRRQQVQAARTQLNQPPMDRAQSMKSTDDARMPPMPAEKNPLRSRRDREPE